MTEISELEMLQWSRLGPRCIYRCDGDTRIGCAQSATQADQICDAHNADVCTLRDQREAAEGELSEAKEQRANDIETFIGLTKRAQAAEGVAIGAKMLGKAIMKATQESGCIWTPETDAEDWNPDAHVNITLTVREMRMAFTLSKGLKGA